MLRFTTAALTAAILGTLAFGPLGPAAAQTPAAPAPKAATPAAAPKKPAIRPKSERTPESLACSSEADAKGLKGKERQKFRRACLKNAKPAAKKS
jgi:hypothetical protein